MVTNIQVGKSYKTRGGWKAKVIHVGPYINVTCIGRDTIGHLVKWATVVAVHENPDLKPSDLQSGAIYKSSEIAYHDDNGKAVPTALIGTLPPTFGREVLHPADFIEEI